MKQSVKLGKPLGLPKKTQVGAVGSEHGGNKVTEVLLTDESSQDLSRDHKVGDKNKMQCTAAMRKLRASYACGKVFPPGPPRFNVEKMCRWRCR